MEKEMDLSDLEKILVGKGTDHERWEWRIKGTDLCHHPYEPAVQYKNGNWTWYCMNKGHKWDGPATNWRGEYRYWIHGKELTYDKWLVDPERLYWLKNQIEGI